MLYGIIFNKAFWILQRTQGLPSHVQRPPSSPCPCLSPSRLRGLVRLPETEHHSVRMRLPKAPLRQEGAGSWLGDTNYCLLSMSFGGIFYKLTKSWPVFHTEYQCKQTLLELPFLLPRRLSGVCGVRGYEGKWLFVECIIVWWCGVCWFVATVELSLQGQWYALPVHFPFISNKSFLEAKTHSLLRLKYILGLLKVPGERVHVQVVLNHILCWARWTP